MRVEAEAAEQECREQGLQAYEQRVRVIGPSVVLGESSRQQVARPQSWSWTHLWQSLQPLVEAEAVDYCSISLLLQRTFLHGFGIDFAKYC